MPYKYMSPKPNHWTVWLMFILGTLVGIGFAYVAIDPDGLIGTIGERVCSDYIVSHTDPATASTVDNVMQDVEDLLNEAVETVEVAPDAVIVDEASAE